VPYSIALKASDSASLKTSQRDRRSARRKPILARTNEHFVSRDTLPLHHLSLPRRNLHCLVNRKLPLRDPLDEVFGKHCTLLAADSEVSLV
jgi:hypothetical protein